MIRGYSDHAANERTFLAWVRTGIAVIAFGFVVEKFNLFVLAMASTSSLDAGRRLQLERLSGSFGRYDGLALIFVGLALVVNLIACVALIPFLGMLGAGIATALTELFVAFAWWRLPRGTPSGMVSQPPVVSLIDP